MSKSLEPKADDPHYKNLDRYPSYCSQLLRRAQLDPKTYKITWTVEELVDLLYLKTREKRLRDLTEVNKESSI